jgi:hypothetical protein
MSSTIDNIDQPRRKAASMPSAMTDLVPRIPEIPLERDEDMVISRSRRRALGGVITEIVLTPDGSYRVEGPGWELEATTRSEALTYARYGPPKSPGASRGRDQRVALRTDIKPKLREAMRSYWEARGRLETARELAYEAIREAAAAGMSLRAIAEQTDLSYQRIAQIVSGE